MKTQFPLIPRLVIFVSIACTSDLATTVNAQSVSFYQGKNIRIITSDSSGGGYDRWSRLFASHMRKYIAGNPAIIVQSMPGAGGRVAANYVYGVAKPDGLTLLMASRYLAMDQLVGSKDIGYDVRKFNWIGSPSKESLVLIMRADAPYKSMEDIIKAKEPPKCGDVGTSSSGYQLAKLLEETVGARINVVLGYADIGLVDLAVERGEIVCRGQPVQSHFTREPHMSWDKRNFDRHIVQTGRTRDTRMAEVPTIYELMDQYKTPDVSRRVAQVILSGPEFGYPMVAAPAIPGEQLKILRAAYSSVLKDVDFLVEIKKLRLELNPSTAEELQNSAAEVVGQPTEVVERVRKLLND
ncbi:MAG TPA: tripartite tricarboxylate transporter substrate-binding protein [Pyrinomonadaceae bacterium]|nr:tripartite tricarboxylate transporter substrate-binding protein [Pyrinomonadaceae bacterium]